MTTASLQGRHDGIVTTDILPLSPAQAVDPIYDNRTCRAGFHKRRGLILQSLSDRCWSNQLFRGRGLRSTTPPPSRFAHTPVPAGQHVKRRRKRAWNDDQRGSHARKLCQTPALTIMIHAVETGEGGLSCQRHGGSVEVSPPKGDKTAPKWSLRGKVV